MQLPMAVTLVAAVLLAAAAATSEAAITYGHGQQAVGQDDLTLTGTIDDSYVQLASTIVNEQFNLSHKSSGEQGYKASYATFMADVDFHVSGKAARRIQRHPVLGQQKLRDPPATILKLTITADPGARASFFLRSDNLYLMAFANRQGMVFSFKGDSYTLPGSKVLSFGSKYRDIFRNTGHDGLLRVLVNRVAAVDHLKALSGYQAGAPDEGLRMPLAFFILTLCEAERFTPIREAVMERWEKTTATNIDKVLDHRTNTVLLDLVVKWRDLSCALLTWNSNGETPGAWRRIPEARDVFPRYGVTTAQGALATINPILNCV